jgi:two-component system, NtrC family, sensor kinase
VTHHILVVDDEPDVEALISQKFRRKIRQGDYLFSFVQNGEQAYQLVSKNPDGHPPVEMVLTDINMPVMDGLTLLKKLNRLEQPPMTVVISAYSDMDNIRTAMNNGAFDFLIKPLNFEDLVITLDRTLAAVATIRDNQQQLAQAQVQLMQSEKMSSLGLMVAGIAHEINNPINFIHGNLKPACSYIQDLMSLVELYQETYPEPTLEIKNHIEDIHLDFLCEDLPKLVSSLSLGTERIRDLVLSLRNFSRLDEAEVKSVDLHAGIDSTLVLLLHRLQSDGTRPEIKVVKQYGDLPLVNCHPSQLNQVFMNILVNAIDALEDAVKHSALTPTITIATAMTQHNSVQITIADNGPGIPEEIHKQIFDSFFTTKEVNKGTGLGLAISHQIVVKKHGGQLICRSTPTANTEFVIELPILGDSAIPGLRSQLKQATVTALLS